MTISFNKVNKFYNLNDSKKIKNIFSFIFKKKIFHALKNITLDIEKGEAVSFIGRNGAGKSTLLKLISEVIKPSSGEIKIFGSVRSILELGIGLNEELSGEDNIFLILLLNGFKKKDIENIKESIIEFSELKNFIMQPVKYYSSGMKARLAFSILISDRPDILIIDEALAVGDTNFQIKCYEKLKQYKYLGTTLIFVSHDMNAVQYLCEKAYLIDYGKIILSGKPEIVVNEYNQLISKENKRTKIESKLFKNDYLELKNFNICDVNKNSINNINSGQNIVLEFSVTFFENIDELNIGFAIKNSYGQNIIASNYFLSNKKFYKAKKNRNDTFEIRFDANFCAGGYSITLAFHDKISHLNKTYAWIDNIKSFTCIDFDNSSSGILKSKINFSLKNE